MILEPNEPYLMQWVVETSETATRLWGDLTEIQNVSSDEGIYVWLRFNQQANYYAGVS